MDITLSLSDDLRMDIERVVCQRICDAVEAASDRNDQLEQWDDQLEGVVSGSSLVDKRWKNASECNDPIIRENHLEILGAGMQALLQDPLCQVQASDPQDEEDARIQEQWFSAKRHEIGFNKAVYNLWYNALRDTAAVCFCPWKQVVRNRRVTLYKPHGQDDAQAIYDNEREDGTDYDEVTGLVPETMWEGIDPQAIDLYDFYIYPGDAQDAETALGCGHRIVVTSEWLMDGIDDYGLDAEAVRELLSRGSGARVTSDTSRERQNQREGVEPANELLSDGLYEIFIWYGRLPGLCENNDPQLSRIPRHLRQDDMEYIVAPAHNIMLRMEFSQYPGRPYFIGGMLPKPNRLQGTAIPQMLDAIQAEANANENYWFDCLDMTAAPACTVKKQHSSEMGKWQIYPSAMIPVDEHDDLQPIRWDRSSQDLVQKQTFLETRGKDIISGRATQLQPKVRKSGEVQAAQQAVTVKIDLYIHNFQETILNRLFPWWISLTLQHMDEDGETFLHDGKTRKITPHQLRGKFQYRARGSSQMATSEARVQIGEFRQKVQMNYFEMKGKMPPETHPFLWHSARELLLDVDTRYPEAWIGEEPPRIEPGQNAQQMPQPMGGANGANGQGGGGGDNPPSAMGNSRVVGGMAQGASAIPTV